MADHIHRLPRILWGDVSDWEDVPDPLANGRAIDFGAPLDSPRGFPEPEEGSETEIFPSGARDSWRTGTRYRLAGSVRHIPRSWLVEPQVATGWDDDPDGWSKFLEWARDARQFRFYPDRRNLVRKPKLDTDADSDGVADNFAASGDTGQVTFSIV